MQVAANVAHQVQSELDSCDAEALQDMQSTSREKLACLEPELQDARLAYMTAKDACAYNSELEQRAATLRFEIQV